MRRALLGLSALAVLIGCANGPAQLPGASVHVLAQSPAGLGELIYEGDVTADEGGARLYRYERRVRGGEGELVAAHATYPAAGGPMVVLQETGFGDGYALHWHRETHAQTGIVSEVRVSADGAAHFEVTRDGRTTVRDEVGGAPIVVGPTLFGFVLAHWDELLRGDEIMVRFAVSDRGQSYRFRLRLISSNDARVVIGFEAADWILRLAVAPARIEFDPASRGVVRYVGRVPPLHEAKPFDAFVEYRDAPGAYR